MAKIYNRARMTTTTTGTGTVTLGSATSGYQTFANAGAADADVIFYCIEDGTDWEIGQGTYTAAGTTLSRTLISSSTGSLLALSGTAEVFIAPLRELMQTRVEFSGKLYLTGRAAPAAFSNGPLDDFSITSFSTATVFCFSQTDDGQINSIAGPEAGRLIILFNTGTSSLAFLTLSDVSGVTTGTAANKIATPGQTGNGSQKYFSQEGGFLWYDGTASLWRPIGPRYFSKATQAGMEAESVTLSTFVTSDTVHFAPSCLKCWGQTTGGATQALSTPSYNMTSITDGASGALTVTIATDFSSAVYSCAAIIEGSAATNRFAMLSSKAAGTIVVGTYTTAISNADQGVGANWVMAGDN